MKTKLLIIFTVVILSSFVIISLNYHIEYDDQESVYLFCEEFLFSGSKRCSVMSLESNEFGIPPGIRHYTMMKASCNNSTGQPDGNCFVNAFENCESASIKQMGSTVEGDPIFYYATIMPEDSCNIHLEIDISLDKWKGILTEGIIQRTCTDVKLSEYHLDFQCGDESQRIQLR